MPKSINALSQRESYTPSVGDKFLWWLSTAEQALLKECVVDRNRYRIVGMTVLATWTFATLAWTYFWSTIINNVLAAVALGIFMGFIILTIDRTLIKGINKYNKTRVWPLLLRSLLAITLGTFMAQPAILFMFDKEIKVQASLDNETRKRAKQRELDSLYNPQKAQLNARKATVNAALNKSSSEVSNARQQFLNEIDGTGGTGKIGIDKIARAKQAEYLKLDSSHRQQNAMLQPTINTIDSSLNAIETHIAQENADFASLLNNGFLTRIQALNNLVKSNSALQWRYILIVIILMLIELMPVLAKSLLPSGTYDEKVRLREEMEIDIAQSNQKKEKELLELYNSLSKDHDEEFLKEMFSASKSERNEKMRVKLAEWKAGKIDTFDGLWQNIKREVLSKQEH